MNSYTDEALEKLIRSGLFRRGQTITKPVAILVWATQTWLFSVKTNRTKVLAKEDFYALRRRAPLFKEISNISKDAATALPFLWEFTGLSPQNLVAQDESVAKCQLAMLEMVMTHMYKHWMAYDEGLALHFFTAVMCALMAPDDASLFEYLFVRYADPSVHDVQLPDRQALRAATGEAKDAQNLDYRVLAATPIDTLNFFRSNFAHSRQAQEANGRKGYFFKR